MTVAHQDAVLTWHEPSSIAVRGTLIVLPGRGEAPSVYERFGSRLAADAYRVHAVTAPSESADAAEEQLAALLDGADQGTPRVVIGSDAGAAFAGRLVAEGRLPGAAALILAGLPTSAAGAPVVDWDTELDLRTACGTHRGRISAGGVQAAELFSDLPAAWLDPATPSFITVPTLGLHGADDQISSLEAARRWYAAVPRAELISITGGRHDALNDATHRTVASSIVLFLERLRLGAALPAIAVTELSTTGATHQS